MAHAKALVTASATGNVAMEGVTMAMVNSYPKATEELAAAAGLSSDDYVITASGTTLTIAAKGAADATKCRFIYNEAASATAAPTYTGTALADINCN
jgi:MSHA pilin protein MshA